MLKKVINSNRIGNLNEIVYPKKIPTPKFNFAFSTLQTVMYQRSKKKCNYCYKKKPEKSFDKFTTNDKMIQIAFSMYPSKIFSHKNCIKSTIKTPKSMGWQWSVKETGGVKINRNWRPGAIRFDVAEIIKKVRAGTIGPLPGRNWNKIK
ncbi:uncharacterized protein LOC113559849 [Rhopalosiphum maidis]|uniref:uncharacterized protein LOC113559849 n=1 Tax=Rhopalosiphum maidis TaxID=43146 RepID=UPI000EFDEE1D|nr:uncharacterized protein LOC113559849 [Rhopalosiphum maidis]